MRIVFFATSDESLNILQELSVKHDIVAVISKKPNSGTKRRNFSNSKILEFASDKYLTFEPDILDKKFEQKIENLKPDLSVVVAYGKILKKSLIETPKFGTINIHPSLLPKYRGPSPVQNTIINQDLETGFTIPMKLNLNSALSFAIHPSWAFNYFTKPKWELSNLKNHIDAGTSVMTSIGDYFTQMLDNSLDWKGVEKINKKWGRQFAIKGIMSVDDAKKAVDVGATCVMISNHGGRQLDGARSPFDQLAEIVDAVGDKVDVVCEGGIRRGTHVLKALSLGAKACSGGRMYLYALAAGGQKGVEKTLSNLRSEIERDMRLMGVSNISQLSQKNLRFR